MVPVLRPLISPNNTINAYPSNNSLVITDYADNVARIARIVESVDQPSLNAPQIVPLKHASAADVAQMLARLADTNGTPASEGAQKIAVLADLRTNSIILRGENPSKVAQLRTLAESLDKPSGDGKGQLRVVYLKNAEAVKVAEMLRSLSGGGVTTSGTAPTGAAAAGAAVSTTVGSSGVTIQADIASNAILINATEPVYNNLRAVIEQLDAKRAQVFVEALIVEVSTDNAAEFGIQWQDFTGLNSTKTRVIGGTNFGGAGTNIIGTATAPTSIGGGLNVGIIRGTVNIPGIGAITNLGLLARALDKTTKANILSTPNVVTLDNEEAKIVIGQNVPFITGQYAQTGTAGAAGSTTPSPFQTIERRDVGLTLRIKPQITEGGQIKLKIFQEASSVQDRTNAAGIITNKRSIESVVEVEDGRIIALGGLLEDKFDNGVDKVPIAGDLPFFGNLFKYETRRQVKTNLMVFLRPVILRDQPSAQGISLDRYDLLLKAQERTQPASSAVLPDMQTPLLAPLKLSPTMAPAKP